jgi:hypothetical protein
MAPHSNSLWNSDLGPCGYRKEASTQLLATLLDGAARHTPEGLAFKARAEVVGFKQAVQERDSGAPIADS